MEPIIEFKDYSFKYRAQKEPTLKNINLKIYPGEKVLIVGRQVPVNRHWPIVSMGWCLFRIRENAAGL